MSAPELPAEETVDLLDRPEAGGKAIRGTAIRTLGFGVITLLGLISAPVLTRHLDVVDFGRYTTVLSLVTLLSLVTEGGLSALGMRELAVLDEAAKRAFMRNLVGMRLVLTLIGTALAVLFAAVAGYGSTIVAGTALAGAGALTYAAQGTAALPLNAELRMGWITAADVLRQAVFVVAIVAFVIAGAGLLPLLAATIPAGLASTALLAWVLRGRVVWRPAFEREAWRRMLRAALPIATAGAVNSAYFRVVILLMSLIASAVETGYYALSFRVIEILVSVPVLIVGPLLPILSRAARNDQERLAFAFRLTSDAALIAGTFLALLTFVGAPLAMFVLTGSGTGPPVGALRIQSVTLLAVFLNVAYSSVLIAMHHNRDLVLANVATLAVTAVAAGILIPLYGAHGGAAAAAGGEYSLLACYAVMLRRARPDLRPSLRFAVRAAVAAGVALAASALIRLPTVPNLTAVVIAAVVYVLVLAAIRGLPREVVDALLRREEAAT
jgi:O-antigen/teichoic acid export membrane protein